MFHKVILKNTTRQNNFMDHSKMKFMDQVSFMIAKSVNWLSQIPYKSRHNKSVFIIIYTLLQFTHL